MTTRRTLIGLCCAIALAASAPRARAALQQETPETNAIPSSQLEISFYQPRAVHVDTLSNLADELYGEWIEVDQAAIPGRPGGSVSVRHFLGVDGTLLIRDTAAEVSRIRAGLEQLERSLRPDSFATDKAPKPSKPSLVDFQYEPRHVSALTLDLALSRFKRTVMVPLPAGATGQMSQVPNISALPERNLLIAFDTPEVLAEIGKRIAEVDVAAAQVTISYLVISGKERAPVQGEKAAPADLVETLRRLVPSESFTVEHTGLLRGSVRASMSARDNEADMQLRLEPAGFDRAGAQLTLGDVSFEYQGRSLQTAATLRSGEYLVIGAAGHEPTFLVLRLTLD